jgi:hypothetical protein
MTKKTVKRVSPAPVHHFDGEEIHGGQNIPVRPQEFLPGRPFLPVGRGLNPVPPQDVGDRAAGHAMVQVGERSLHPGVAPRAILGRHAHHESLDLGHDVRPSGPAPEAAVVLMGDQSPMPREQRIRRDDGPNRRERPPAERLGFRGQADTLIVGESHSPGTELLAQHAVLRLEMSITSRC